MVEGVSGVKPVLLLIIVALNLTARVEGSNPADTLLDRTVITAAMIRHAGLTRVGDLFLLIDDWNTNTTDGFTWKASPNGLSAFQRQNWIVMLDGHRMDLKVFDTINLSMAPVALDQIDYVEVIGAPQLHEGEFTDKGLIHIHTTKPKAGLSILGHLSAGNKIGDPGPYIYTDYRTTNVDRIGPDGSLAVDAGTKSYYMRANLIVQQYSFADRAMRERVAITVPDWPGMFSVISSLKIGIDQSHGRHELLISNAHFSKYFLFFKPFSRELPVINNTPHLGINGTFSSPRGRDIIYNLKYSVNHLKKHPNTFNFDFDWKLHNMSANIESNSDGVYHRKKIGIGFERFALETSYQLDNDSYVIAKIYGKLNYGSGDKIQQSVSTLLAHSGGSVAIKGAYAIFWKINSKHSSRAILSFSQRLIEEDNSLWYWSERGYDILRANDVDYTIFGNITKSQQFTGDLTWKTTVSDNFTIETTGSYRLFSGLYLERQSFQFNPQDCSFYSPIQIYGGKKGQVIGGKIAVNHRFIPQLSHHLFYGYWTEIAGDDVFKGVWTSIPKHKASYRLTYTPVESFAIWAMVSYRSATSWSDYLNVDGQIYEVAPQVTATYASTVKGVAIFDLQIQKWFWHGRLIGNLLFRNVWNQDYRYHPIGASFDLSMFIKVKVLLNS